MKASKQMKKYFQSLEEQAKTMHKIAEAARKRSYDPAKEVEIMLAKNVAEQVLGLVSVVAPQLKESNMVKRIQELEKEYGPLDWRVAMTIAVEIAQEKFCKFENKIEAMEVGIRTGFTYVTFGVVSSPLDGFTSLEIKKRRDGKEYFCLNYSGPIRNAGGTMAAVSVIIADYVRQQFGYSKYDPDEKEVKRTFAEISDYHDWVTNLQYFPSEEESTYMMQNLPVEISGDPSEKYEVSNINLKDLPRVNTNRIRSGFCLLHSSCLPLKGPKLWAKLGKWYKEFGINDWDWLEEFITIQKKNKAKGKQDSGAKIKPDYTFVSDIVAGRPVLGHPLRTGAFRLRYGRSRVSGYSGQAINPATMHSLLDYIASGTQCKVERPGKGTVVMPCDTIDGPIVKLTDGSVKYLANEDEAIKFKKEINKILYLGDILINYGDFFDRAHALVPSGYCEEHWIQELEEASVKLFGTIDEEKISEITGISESSIKKLREKPLTMKISYSAAKKISESLSIPLHPKHIYYYNSLNLEQAKKLLELKAHHVDEDKIVFENIKETKNLLELIGMPHDVHNREFLIISGKQADAIKDLKPSNGDNVLQLISNSVGVEIRDKNGIFIGARMGRPEKAKMRKLQGQPHGLFPVSDEGGRLRSFQSVLEKGKVESDFSVYYCEKCDKRVVLPRCYYCDSKTKRAFIAENDELVFKETEGVKLSQKQSVPFREIMDYSLNKLKTRVYPDLIKGVRGTINKNHIPEHPIKGILRAKHKINVNKDGTTRYDCSEITLTHFKPKEVGASINKLIEMGYEKDINGKSLKDVDQILELKPQDVVLPACLASPDEPSDEVLFRTTKFIDELLVKLYKQKPYYNLDTKEELIGHLVIGLAPHTSTGTLGRIVGFSKTQGLLAHPYYHAAMRRDCDGDESCVFLLMDGFLNFSKSYLPGTRGGTMDAPLVLTYNLDPSGVDDMVFNLDIEWNYPLELYRAAQEYKMPWDIKIELINERLGKVSQFESMGFTHDTDNFNAGVLCSAYKLLPSMGEKLDGQMELASRINAVDESDVARIVIEKHFMRDIRGNLRKFSQQGYRCVKCNDKYRRPPLNGICRCGGKIIFTISEGGIVKYLEPAIMIAEKYGVSTYLKQTLELTKRMIEDLFGKEKEKQIGLDAWTGSAKT